MQVDSMSPARQDCPNNAKLSKLQAMQRQYITPNSAQAQPIAALTRPDMSCVVSGRPVPGGCEKFKAQADKESCLLQAVDKKTAQLNNVKYTERETQHDHFAIVDLSKCTIRYLERYLHDVENRLKTATHALRCVALPQVHVTPAIFVKASSLNVCCPCTGSDGKR